MQDGSQALKHPNKRRRLRALLDQNLISDPELDSFCMDCFPDIHQQFSIGMTRLMKINLLIIYEEDNVILDKLDSYIQCLHKQGQQLKRADGFPAGASPLQGIFNANGKSLITLIGILKSNRLLVLCLLLPALFLLLSISLDSSSMINDIHRELGRLAKKIHKSKYNWYRTLLKINNIQQSNDNEQTLEVQEDDDDNGQIEIITDEITLINQIKNSSSQMSQTPIYKQQLPKKIVRNSTYRTELVNYEDKNLQRTESNPKTQSPASLSNYEQSNTDHFDLGTIPDMSSTHDLESDGSKMKITSISLELAGCLPLEQLNVDPPTMVFIPKGSFIMGSPSSESERSDDEIQHEVRITRNFDIMETEVSRFDYDLLKELTERKKYCYFPGFTEGKKEAANNINWADAISHCNRMSAHEGLEPCYVFNNNAVTWPRGLDCAGYRLPTEAEWEYTARAGRLNLYSGSDNPDYVAWYSKDSNDLNHDGRDHGTLMKSKKPNFWGIYDMSGNVSEWVYDYYTNYALLPPVDPIGPVIGSQKVHRGGNLMDSTAPLRVASRGKVFYELHDGQQISVGFRMVRTHGTPQHGL